MCLTDGVVRARLLEAREHVRDISAQIYHEEHREHPSAFQIAALNPDLRFWKAVERACLSWARESGSWEESAAQNAATMGVSIMTFDLPEPRSYTYACRDSHSKRERREIPDVAWHIVPKPPKPWAVHEPALCGSKPTPRYLSGQAALASDRRIPKGGTYSSWDVTTTRRSNTEETYVEGLSVGSRCPDCERIAAERGITVVEEPTA